MNISRHAYPIIGLITLLSAVSLAAPRMKAAAGPVTNTNVVNNLDNPVPTVAVGTTAVTQSGTWSVGLARPVALTAGTTVKVINDTGPLVTKDAGVSGRTPFNQSVEITLPDGQDDLYGITIADPPANKRFVIESIYGRAELPPGQTMVDAVIQSGSVPGTSHKYPVLFTNTGGSAFVQYAGALSNATIRLEQGAQTSLGIRRSSGSGVAVISVGYSGYLEDPS